MTKRPVNILVLGSEGVGKTALVVRFLTGRFLTEYAKLDEITYERNVLVDNKHVTVRVTDVGGKCMDSRYGGREALSKVDGVFLLYSITDTKSYQVAEIFCEKFKLDQKTSIPAILLGNKNDLEHSREVPRQSINVAVWQTDGFCSGECSASAEATEVIEIFHRMIRKILEKREAPSKSPRKLSATTLGSPRLIRNHLRRRFSMFTRERTSTM